MSGIEGLHLIPCTSSPKQTKQPLTKNFYTSTLIFGFTVYILVGATGWGRFEEQAEDLHRANACEILEKKGKT